MAWIIGELEKLSYERDENRWWDQSNQTKAQKDFRSSL